jgi:hypothetical protein
MERTLSNATGHTTSDWTSSGAAAAGASGQLPALSGAGGGDNAGSQPQPLALPTFLARQPPPLPAGDGAAAPLSPPPPLLWQQPSVSITASGALAGTTGSVTASAAAASAACAGLGAAAAADAAPSTPARRGAADPAAAGGHGNANGASGAPDLLSYVPVKSLRDGAVTPLMSSEELPLIPAGAPGPAPAQPGVEGAAAAAAASGAPAAAQQLSAALTAAAAAAAAPVSSNGVMSDTLSGSGAAAVSGAGPAVGSGTGYAGAALTLGPLSHSSGGSGSGDIGSGGDAEAQTWLVGGQRGGWEGAHALLAASGCLPWPHASVQAPAVPSRSSPCLAPPPPPHLRSWSTATAAPSRTRCATARWGRAASQTWCAGGELAGLGRGLGGARGAAEPAGALSAGPSHSRL